MALAFGIELPLWAYLIGGILGFLPDFDVIWPILIQDRPNGDHHQTLMHRPIFLLPIVAVTGWLVGGFFWSTTATLCVFWHYLHDTPEFGGGGLAWFWPFSQKYWSILKGGISPERSIMAMSESEHRKWLEEKWLQPSKISFREIGLGAWSLGISCAIITWNRLGWWSLVCGAATLYSAWFLVLGVWIIRKIQTKKKART